MKRKALRVAALLFMCAILVTGLNVAPATANAASKKATKITLSSTSKTLYIGQSATIKVSKVTPGNATKAVTWKTSNAKIATVKNGKITAKKAGKATITAVSKSNSKVKATCKVTVKNPTTTFSKKSITVNASETTDLRKYLSVKGASTKTDWTTSNKKVATVNKKGIVTFKKSGTVTITAKANGKKASIKLTAPTLTMNKTSATIWYPTTKTVSLSAKAYNYKGKKTNVTWTTSNGSIAKVNDGKVTFYKAGTVTITAKANGVSKSCKITAKQETVTLNKTNLSLYKGETVQLSAKVAGTNQKVTWTSSDKAVSVDQNGKVSVNAETTKTVYISATANGVTAKCAVKVNAAKLTLDQQKLTLLTGEKAVVKATVTGANKNVSWKSSDEAIAEVVNGTITAKKTGTVTITATANNVSVTVNVSVVAEREVKPVKNTVSGQDFYSYTFSKQAKVFKATYKDECMEVPVEALLAEKQEVVRILAKYGTDVEAMFKASGLADLFDGVVSVKKVGANYEVTVVDVETGETTTATILASYANGMYTYGVTETVEGVTFAVKVSVSKDATKANVTMDIAGSTMTVATYEETATSYVASYNRSLIELVAGDAAKELFAKIDQVKVTEQ